MKYLIKKLPATDEWVVRVFDDNGRRLADADYYTGDREDAEMTRDAMIAQEKAKTATATSTTDRKTELTPTERAMQATMRRYKAERDELLAALEKIRQVTRQDFEALVSTGDTNAVVVAHNVSRHAIAKAKGGA